MFAEEQLIGFLHNLGLHRGQTSSKHGRVEEHEHEQTHQLFQVSTLNAIMEGAYDGALTIGQLREHGNFGLGTFNGLDGEMIVLDGVVYQAKVDGNVHRPADDDRTPFAVDMYSTSCSSTVTYPPNISASSIWSSPKIRSLPTAI